MSIRSTWLQGRFRTLDGTSVAVPDVAGAAAPVWSANSLLSAEGVRQILRDTALDLGPVSPDPEYGWGLVDAFAGPFVHGKKAFRGPNLCKTDGR